MRQISFRAWDNQGKCMVDWLTIRQTAWNRGEYPLMYKMLTNQCQGIECNGFILMLSTGLKDKNGAEIYEGDILLDTLTKMTYVVKFGRCVKYAFNGWYVENEEHGYVTQINGDYDTDTNSQIEVIGNIYEPQPFNH